MNYKLLVSIVPHDSGELISNAAKSAGAGGGTIVMGRGTASNGVLQLLGLGDTSKDIGRSILSSQKARQKVFQFGKAPRVLLRRMNVGIVIVNCYVKIARQIFQRVTGTRRAASVQQKARLIS